MNATAATTESAPADWVYLCQRRYAIKARALANRLYQQQRQRIFEFREGLVKAASLAAGSVALANVANPSVVQWAAAVITIGTAASLVFGWGGKARDAARRAADWTLLDHDIDTAGERTFTEDQIDAWQARCAQAEMGEPAANTRLFSACSVQAALALGGAPSEKARWGIPVVIP